MHKILTYFAAFAVCAVYAGISEARPEYAEKEVTRCRTCHLKNGEAPLNKFGKDYKKTLAKDQGLSISEGKPAKGEDAGVSAPGVKNETAVKDEEQESPAGVTPEPEEPEEMPAPVPMKTFRWQTPDGVMVFSDTPGLKPPKVAAPLRRSKKNAVKKPVKQAKKPVVQVSSKPAAAPVREKKLPYGECMEFMLRDVPAPKTADELMKNLLYAESLCSGG